MARSRLPHFHGIRAMQDQVPLICSLHNIHTYTHMDVSTGQWGQSNCRITQILLPLEVRVCLLRNFTKYLLVIYYSEQFALTSALGAIFQFQCTSCAVTFSTHTSEGGDNTPHVPRSFRWKWNLGPPDLPLSPGSAGLWRSEVILGVYPPSRRVRSYLHCDPARPCTSNSHMHTLVVISVLYVKMDYESCGFPKK